MSKGLFMQQDNIVILKTSEDRLTHLDGNIAQHTCYSFELPDAEQLDEHRLFDDICELSPQAILLDIQADYDYPSFLSRLNEGFNEKLPTILGILSDKNDPQTTQLLTELPIDSFVFSSCSLDRLINKLGQLERLRLHNDELHAEIEQTSRTAMTAMKAASEVGLLMQLVEWLNVCHSPTEVTNALFRVCKSLDLKAFCMVKEGDNCDYYPENAVHETARKILNEAQYSDIRVLSKNRIVVFRVDYLVLLVTNAPWQDEDKYGRIRDILLQASVLAEAKVRTLSVNNLIEAQHNQVQGIMTLIKNVSSETQMYARNIMKNLSNELHEAAMTLDLTETQEEKLTELSEEALDAIEVLYENSDALEQHFHSLIDSITQVRALTKPPSNPNPTPEISPAEEDELAGDISLF